MHTGTQQVSQLVLNLHTNEITITLKLTVRNINDDSAPIYRLKNGRITPTRMHCNQKSIQKAK